MSCFFSEAPDSARGLWYSFQQHFLHWLQDKLIVCLFSEIQEGLKETCTILRPMSFSVMRYTRSCHSPTSFRQCKRCWPTTRTHHCTLMRSCLFQSSGVDASSVLSFVQSLERSVLRSSCCTCPCSCVHLACCVVSCAVQTPTLSSLNPPCRTFDICQYTCASDAISTSGISDSTLTASSELVLCSSCLGPKSSTLMSHFLSWQNCSVVDNLTRCFD